MAAWCERRYSPASPLPGGGGAWVVKDAGANGSAGIWVLGGGNWRDVVAKVDEGARLAVQQYVARPMLWRGRKVHIRCYSLLFGDGRAYLYRRAFLHAANLPFAAPSAAESAFEPQVHITNCCMNKGHAGFAGEIVFDMAPSADGAAAEPGLGAGMPPAGGVICDFPPCYDAVAACLQVHSVSNSLQLVLILEQSCRSTSRRRGRTWSGSARGTTSNSSART